MAHDFSLGSGLSGDNPTCLILPVATGSQVWLLFRVTQSWREWHGAAKALGLPILTALLFFPSNASQRAAALG